MNTISIPGFSAEAALASRDKIHWGIAPSHESGSGLRVVPSSLFDILVGAAIGFIEGGPVGAVQGGIAAGIAQGVWGGGESGGGGMGFAPCYPFGPCIGTGVFYGDMEVGTMAQICYPGGVRTVPCYKARTLIASVGRIGVKNSATESSLYHLHG